MIIEKITTVVAVDDVAGSVALWSTMLGVAPTFQDGARWAQFDTAGGRIALAAKGEAPHGSGLMLKVADLEATWHRLAGTAAVGEIVRGAHERRFTVAGGNLAVTYYTAL